MNTIQPEKYTISMEIKAVLTAFSWFGYSAYVLGIFANWGDAKAIVLFLIGVVFFIIKIFFYIIERLDARDARKIKMESDQLDLEYKKEGHDNIKNKKGK